MLKRVWLFFLCIPVLLLLVGPLSIGPTLAQGVDQIPSRAYIFVNGAEASATPGTVLGQGRRRGNTCVDMPEVKMGMAGFGGGYGAIVIQTTNDCAMVVREVTFDPNGRPPADNGDGHRRQVEPEIRAPESNTISSQGPGKSTLLAVSDYIGWAESEYNDVVDIDLTRVHAKMKYSDDGTKVFNGREPFNQCFWLPDWNNLSCRAAWWPNGPDLVYINTEGEFEFNFDPRWDHLHKAQYEGRPGGWNNWWCDRRGQTVPGGFWKCEGARQDA